MAPLPWTQPVLRVMKIAAELVGLAEPDPPRDSSSKIALISDTSCERTLHSDPTERRDAPLSVATARPFAPSVISAAPPVRHRVFILAAVCCPPGPPNRIVGFELSMSWAEDSAAAKVATKSSRMLVVLVRFFAIARGVVG